MLHIMSKPMTEKAQINCVNWSSIATELIQAAGNCCEYFASDLFYDLKEIESAIINAENRVFFIGFRDCGVDSEGAIKYRLSDNPHYNYAYIRIYRLEITVGDGDMTLELKRVDAYDAKKEICGRD